MSLLEVAIIDDEGNVLVNSLVKPEEKTSWPIAQSINGIFPEMVAYSPSLADLMPTIREAVEGATVVIYNAEFDIQFFPSRVFDGCDIECAMLRYAERVGDWNDYRGDYRWHKLTAAARAVGHVWDGAAHRALGDTQATRSVWRWLHQEG